MILVNIFLLLCVSSEFRAEDDCENYHEDCNPLMLTPLINEGNITLARRMSEVKLVDFNSVQSYSGYLTVDELFDSHLFFWFFPAENDYEEAPVILWLQGGPGTSTLLGVFLEHGPFVVTPDYEVVMREHRWTKNHSVIYIDNPVGTGFSTTNLDGFARNETVIAEHLYTALRQFFKMFPELQSQPFFVSGQSYAGKYVPAICHKILVENRKAKQKINLQGLTIGNGFTDPEHQMQYSELYFQNGLIDLKVKMEVEEMERNIVSMIRQREWKKAYNLFCDLLFYDGHQTLFENATGFNSPHHLLHTDPTDAPETFSYMNFDEFRIGLHLFPAIPDSGNKVRKNLILDFLQSASPWVEELLEHYRVLIYHGQLDLIVSYPGTLNYLNHLNFTGSSDYKNADRQKWYLNDTLMGYVKVGGNLTEVLVRNSGHMVPKDQPAAALDLITRFTRNQFFSQEEK